MHHLLSTAMIGECGLHFYKVGRIATIMSEMKSLTTTILCDLQKHHRRESHSVTLRIQPRQEISS